MTFISYAQNYEDVILNRVLQDVKNGFYIDVGANDPVEDSVTKAFYDNGWKGINIEPQEEFFTQLQQDRPEDINLNLAVSSTQKSIEFYVSKVRGWSTTDELTSKDPERESLFSEIRTVQAKSLDEICEQNSVKQIHFLKIDVEGAEKDVLESFSFSVKPWIVVVEATLPNSNIDASSNWEYILTQNSYKFVYFDGINKFYLSPQKPELEKHFAYPPNVLDEFIVFPLHEALQENEELHKRDHLLDELLLKNAALKEELILMNEELALIKLQMNMMVNSRSWQITKPLRLFVQYIKKLLGKSTEHSEENIFSKNKSQELEYANLSEDAKEIYQNLKK
ncbi:methyltransferase, FkbM family [Epsilonproteobacteria bacterium SCGC AD-308-E02]|nr:methyltransferase, FkbM family [Epsilonproteobacteria bacterium SCGC AD-308-E02]